MRHVVSLPALSTVHQGSGLQLGGPRQSPSPPRRHSQFQLPHQSDGMEFRSPIINLEVEFTAALEGADVLGPSPTHAAACFTMLKKLASAVAPSYRPLLGRLHDELLQAVYDRDVADHPPHFAVVAQVRVPSLLFGTLALSLHTSTPCSP